MSSIPNDEPTNPKYEELDATGQWLAKLLRTAAQRSDSAARAAAVVELELVEQYLDRTDQKEGAVPDDIFNKIEFQSIYDRLWQVRIAQLLIRRMKLGDHENELMRAIIAEVFRSRMATKFVRGNNAYFGDDLGHLVNQVEKRMK